MSYGYIIWSYKTIIIIDMSLPLILQKFFIAIQFDLLGEIRTASTDFVDNTKGTEKVTPRAKLLNDAGLRV